MLKWFSKESRETSEEVGTVKHNGILSYNSDSWGGEKWMHWQIY